MYEQLEKLFEEYELLLSSFEEINQIVNNSKEAKTVLTKSTLSLLPQFESLAEIDIFS